MRKYVIAGIIVVLLVAIAVTGVKQKNNIEALFYSLKYTDEELNEMKGEKSEKLAEAVGREYGEKPRDLTAEETQAYVSGKITLEDAINICLDRITLKEVLAGVKWSNPENINAKNGDKTTNNKNISGEKKSENDSKKSTGGKTDKKSSKTKTEKNGSGKSENGKSKNTASKNSEKINTGKQTGNVKQTNENANGSASAGNKATKPTPEQTNGTASNKTSANTSDENGSGADATVKSGGVADLVAELYVMKASFSSQIDSIKAQAFAEYQNTPSGKKNGAWKADMISRYSSMLSSLEAKCDSQVEGVISRINAQVSSAGGNESLIDSIRSMYESEKGSKKAELMNDYLNN